MGLDTWFLIKTIATLEEAYKKQTGVCSGLFGLVPKLEDSMYEIGYLRKCWPITNLFLKYREHKETETNKLNNQIYIHEEEDPDIKINLTYLEEIEKFVDELLTYEFDEDGYIKDDEFDFDYSDCYNLKFKLEQTKAMIIKFKELQKLDPNIELYVNYWY